MLARARRLPEPWKSELPFWRGRVAEAGGNTFGALDGYARVLAERPYTAVGETAKERLLGLDAAARAAFLRDLRLSGESLLARGDARGAKQKLLPPRSSATRPRGIF